MIGLSASTDNVVYVDVRVPSDDDEPLEILEDGNWKLQKGDRSDAYQVLHQQCVDYIREAPIEAAVVKASAVMGRMSLKLGMLHTAEVRGIVIAAAASECSVIQLSKGLVSRTYGDRNVDEYIDDDEFWDEHTVGKKLRKMSREVAMLLVAARDR